MSFPSYVVNITGSYVIKKRVCVCLWALLFIIIALPPVFLTMKKTNNFSNIYIFIYLFAISVFSPGETFTTTETQKCELMSVEERVQRIKNIKKSKWSKRSKSIFLIWSVEVLHNVFACRRLQHLWQWRHPALQRLRLLREIQLPVHPHPLHPRPGGVRHHHAEGRRRPAAPRRDNHQQCQDRPAERQRPGGGETVGVRLFSELRWRVWCVVFKRAPLSTGFRSRTTTRTSMSSSMASTPNWGAPCFLCPSPGTVSRGGSTLCRWEGGRPPLLYFTALKKKHKGTKKKKKQKPRHGNRIRDAGVFPFALVSH